MYHVDVYLRVRRAVMVDGMSIREVSRVFGLHRDTVRKILARSTRGSTRPSKCLAIAPCSIELPISPPIPLPGYPLP